MKKVLMVLLSVLFSCLVYAQEFDNSLYVFDFMNDGVMPVAERAQLYTEIGFKGITFGVGNEKQVEKLSLFLETDEFKRGKLTIPVLYFPIEIDEMGNWNQYWKQALKMSPSTDLWVIVANRKKFATQEKVLEILREMCDSAKVSGVDVVIYPHDNTFIESAEDALYYIEKVGKTNLYVSLHLCHELREGNGKRLQEVAQTVAPHLKYASVSGSNVRMVPNATGDWSDAIKPLDEGDFPVEDFITALRKIKFQSKTFLHTYGIKQDLNDHLQRSFNEWNKLIKFKEAN
jgi:hypothetical protein